VTFAQLLWPSSCAALSTQAFALGRLYPTFAHQPPRLRPRHAHFACCDPDRARTGSTLTAGCTRSALPTLAAPPPDGLGYTSTPREFLFIAWAFAVAMLASFMCCALSHRPHLVRHQANEPRSVPRASRADSLQLASFALSAGHHRRGGGVYCFNHSDHRPRSCGRLLPCRPSDHRDTSAAPAFGVWSSRGIALFGAARALRFSRRFPRMIIYGVILVSRPCFVCRRAVRGLLREPSIAAPRFSPISGRGAR